MGISRFAKNFLALLGSNVTVQLCRFIIITLLARRLGAELFGVYSYVLLLVTYGYVIVELGLKNLAIRDFSQNKGSQNLVNKITHLRLILAVVVFGGMFVLTKLSFPDGPGPMLALLFGITLFTDALLTDYIVISKERLAVVGLANACQAGFYLAAVYLFVHSTSDLLLAGVFYAISRAIYTGIYRYKTKDILLPKESPADHNFSAIFIGGIPFLIGHLLGTFQATMDLFLLGQFHFSSWLGEYSAALKVTGITLGIVNVALSAVQPKLARFSHDLHDPHLQKLIFLSARLLWVFLTPTLIGCWLFGDQLAFFFFGEGYPRTGKLLGPLSIALTFLTLSHPAVHALFVSSKTKTLLKLTSLNFFVTALLVCIPLSLGRPEGAPWAMAAGCFSVMVLSWRPFKRVGFFSLEDIKILGIPAILMTIPLISPISHPILQFTLSATGFIVGLVLSVKILKPQFMALVKGDIQ